MRAARAVVFPNGQADVERDAHVIFLNNRGRVPFSECERFISWAKPLASITYDPTGDVLQAAYANWFAGYYPSLWCWLQAFIANFKISQMLAWPALPVTLSGGDGSSEQTAVVVRAGETRQGLSEVYAYLARTLGPAGTWRIAQRLTLKSRESSMEQFDIALSDGTERSLYFCLVPPSATDAGGEVCH
ncbi:hypothetical protein EAH82_20540 [Variovorax guangxiensis]|uniref:Uncharacterized protein n=1 Tax=Variovorax guangxiensis TaxID=1775474 RepID=A0A502DCZ9_9BURK|nr:hypothetical protein EAH82_20540 [Variovorax guangxiensis]